MMLTGDEIDMTEPDEPIRFHLTDKAIDALESPSESPYDSSFLSGNSAAAYTATQRIRVTFPKNVMP